MWKDNFVFYKSKSYLFCTSIGVLKKLSPRLSTNLYDCRNQFSTSMGSSDTWSDKYSQIRKLIFMCTPLK